MTQRWERLTFLHWRFDADVVQRRLPVGLQVEMYDGAAWVGLVPFYIKVSLPHAPSVPWASRFCETNVRTYVRDGEGRSGVWFFSLDAERLGAVMTARTTYRLPYFWSDLRITEDKDRIEYVGTRRWPAPSGASSRVVVLRGTTFDASDLTGLDHFLTARWVVFSRWGKRLMFARAAHPAWPLHRAEVVEIDDEFVTAAGLSAPVGQPIVHYSPGVDVRIGKPARTRGSITDP